MIVVNPPAVEVSIVDSRDDQSAVFIILEGKCKIKVDKKEMKDKDKLVDKVLDKCGYK